ncbi:uncharacterized protein TRAVEDRAFT_51755 [Trametes versicolor FP-101664 SS1]|uniref:uncharacterized protein n=1 Tax=Trametes versicolor (strain FP-101664) TaxID=717944 RepID=UPI000462177B|nr:uncharacterized protein TRAVEDRAFT_51755 [Trametes versicolor FP-101664 SS1]EIW54025.1 hypothetical protein TRAVEDRAFT_51755 [Trametes versicolor FP-101664 SS1]
MLDLLEGAMHKSTKWPPLDKLADQLPEEGYKHGADIKVDSADLLKHGARRGGASGAAPSRKRGSDQVEQAAAQEEPKPTEYVLTSCPSSPSRKGPVDVA